MNYKSTRNSSLRVSAAQAISQGISKDGGLFVPENLPRLSLEEIAKLQGMDYVERAKSILRYFLTDFTLEELDHCVRSAYQAEKFGGKDIAPVVPLTDTASILELWHGPTCAFKDMALQLLPHLLVTSASKTCDGKTIVILVATSGDTGKAALEGFKDVPNTRILVFYPEDGVSPMQKRQMNTQQGNNVCVCAIEGNFDDAQSGVKRIFGNQEIARRLEEENMMFSSANSINWGRLVPQIVYYFSAYCDLMTQGKIALGDQVNFVVPTGNFGNILAAYYAKCMGLPVHRLVCASNRNNVLTDFFATGTYDKNRQFFATSSPSMDILISSNLERLLFALSGENDALLKDWMEQLKTKGVYTVPAGMKEKLAETFSAGCCDDQGTRDTIREIFEKYHYLCDTHTAVAVKVYEDYAASTGDKTPTVIASTASPYKFVHSVLGALREDEGTDEFEKLSQLAKISGTQIPAPIAALEQMPVRFSNLCKKEEMEQTVFSLLNI